MLAAIGWLIVHTSLGEPVRSWDETMSRNVALWRTSGWEDVSSAGTSAANTLPVVAGMVVVTAALAALRRWRDLLFIPLALALELSIFLTVNYLVARDRPDVPQLGGQPGTHSFPSGHVAASFVLWFGIAVLLGVGRWRWPWRILAWAVAAVPVLTVAFSRVYRGMHFTTDVMAGLLLGAVALGAAAVATRSSWLAAARRTEEVDSMTTVAVVCHAKKSMGGGLDELRSVLAHEGVEPLWFEVPKSRKAPAAVKEAVREGPTSSSSGAVTARSSAASTPSLASRSTWRSCLPARPTCWPPTSGSPPRSKRPCRSASTAGAGRSTSA